MDKEDYKSKLNEIEQRLGKEKAKLQRDFAFSNNTVSIGDTVVSNHASIIVDKIKYTSGSSYRLCFPACVYIGRVLTAKGKPRKDGKTACIYQFDMKQ